MIVHAFSKFYFLFILWELLQLPGQSTLLNIFSCFPYFLLSLSFKKYYWEYTICHIQGYSFNFVLLGILKIPSKRKFILICIKFWHNLGHVPYLPVSFLFKVSRFLFYFNQKNGISLIKKTNVYRWWGHED